MREQHRALIDTKKLLFMVTELLECIISNMWVLLRSLYWNVGVLVHTAYTRIFGQDTLIELDGYLHY
jgi:hypothetical protein